ncbi:MAG: pyridoxal-phosphate-dependent aminotransferase family protein, partial [Ignavibacteria bacterium]
MNFKSSSHPQRTLMGPGPSDVHPQVLEALSRPTIGHLDPEFIRLMDEIKILLKETFLTKNETTILLSGPGSLGMETCFVNLVEPGDKVLVCVNGFFGGRMKENAERCGAITIIVENEWGKAIDSNKVEEVLKNDAEIKILAFVHAET